MKRVSACAIVAGLLILAALIGLAVILWQVSGDGSLSNRQQTMVALVGTNANVVFNDSPTLTARAALAIATPQASETAGQMVVYLVAPEGSTGPLGPFGCGHYLVPVVRGEIPPTTADRQIAYALLELLSIKDQFYGQSGLMNTLYQSNLTLQNVTVDGTTGQATVKISGQVMLDGECSAPLFQAQIEQTALQFSASGVSIFINDQPIAEVLSGRGTTG